MGLGFQVSFVLARDAVSGAVEESDRGAWLVAGDVDRAVVEAAVREWAAAQR